VILGQQVRIRDIMVCEYHRAQGHLKSRSKFYGLGSSLLDSECLCCFLIEAGSQIQHKIVGQKFIIGDKRSKRGEKGRGKIKV